MRRIVLTVATVVLLYAIVVDAVQRASQPRVSLAAGQSQADH
jgi:hypothetical protein